MPWAACAQVPYTDAFMLRTFSADAPLEGRSSFAVEMVEMRCARQTVFWFFTYTVLSALPIIKGHRHDLRSCHRVHWAGFCMHSP